MEILRQMFDHTIKDGSTMTIFDNGFFTCYSIKNWSNIDWGEKGKKSFEVI